MKFEKFLFSWIPLINVIILRCNMSMLWSKLKKLWVISYFQNFTACSHSNLLWLLFRYIHLTFYLSSSHPSSIHLSSSHSYLFILPFILLFISLFISLNYLFISPFSTSSQFSSRPSVLHLNFISSIYLFISLIIAKICSHLFISPFISLFTSLFISKLPFHLTHLSSHLSSHSSLKKKVPDKGWDEERRERWSNEKKWAQTYVKPNMVLSQISFRGDGGCLSESLHTHTHAYIHTYVHTYIHTYTIVTR